MVKTKPFDIYLTEYEQWFSDNHFVYISELEAIRKVLPGQRHGVEIGVGSGLFASELGITEGCDPSAVMRAKATSRRINAIECIAENLPYENERFDFALLVTTICFVDDARKTFQEINRILKAKGEIIIGFVDKNSLVGQQYLEQKEKSVFYKDAVFYSTKDITDMLKTNGFSIVSTNQTIFNPLDEVKTIQPSVEGSDKGSFVVIKAKKDG